MKNNKDDRKLQDTKKERKRTTEIPKKKQKKSTKLKRKTDIFQRLFDTTTNIIREVWFERNTDRISVKFGLKGTQTAIIQPRGNCK